MRTVSDANAPTLDLRGIVLEPLARQLLAASQTNEPGMALRVAQEIWSGRLTPTEGAKQLTSLALTR